MQYFVLLRRKSEQFSDAEFASRIDAEVEQARALYAEGFVRQIWHRGDVAGACLLIEAGDEAAVRAGLQRLPLVAAGMLEIAEFVPLLPYRGFGPRG